MFSIAMNEAKTFSSSFEQLFLPLHVPQWVTFYDTYQEAEYYYNPATDESVWERPEDDSPVRLWNEQWQPIFDTQSKKWFFYNMNTGESCFDLPSDEGGILKEEEEEYKEEEEEVEKEVVEEVVEVEVEVEEEEEEKVEEEEEVEEEVEEENEEFIGKMKHLAEVEVNEASRSGKHCAEWIEVIDPVSKRTAYYNIKKHVIQFKKPRGWVVLGKIKINKY
jgi:hypothetical protein